MANLITNIIIMLRKSWPYQQFKKTKSFSKLKERYLKITHAWPQYYLRLHGDTIHVSLLKKIIKKYNITNIVETGTYQGYGTILFAKTFPNLQVYSCEINKKSYLEAKKNTSSLKNVHLYNLSSPDFINFLIKNKIISNKTFFYLDAHWLDDWPLEKELNIISNKLKSTLISIDDFKVENNKDFKFDKYGKKECSLSLVNKSLSKRNRYNLLFPNYDQKTLFKDKISKPELVGYTLIFQNMQEEFQEIVKTDFIRKFFLDKSKLVKPTLKNKIK